MSSHPTLKSPARWGLLLGLLVTFLAGGACGYFIAKNYDVQVQLGGPGGKYANPKVNLATFAKIKDGMTREELEALFGDRGEQIPNSQTPEGLSREGLVWRNGEAMIEVWFDNQGPPRKSIAKRPTKLQ